MDVSEFVGGETPVYSTLNAVQRAGSVCSDDSRSDSDSESEASSVVVRKKRGRTKTRSESSPGWITIAYRVIVVAVVLVGLFLLLKHTNITNYIDVKILATGCVTLALHLLVTYLK